MTVQEALAKAKAPVTVEFPERWLLHLTREALVVELRKAQGAAKRTKHASTLSVVEQRAAGITLALASIDAALKAEV